MSQTRNLTPLSSSSSGAPVARGSAPALALALEEFERAHPAIAHAVRLEPRHERTLEHLLGQPNADRRVQVYLALFAADVHLTLGNDRDSVARLDETLALAAEAWDGRLGAGVSGSDPFDRLLSFCDALRRAAAQGKLDHEALVRLRSGLQLGANFRADVLTREAPLPALLAAPAGRTPLPAPGGATRAPARRVSGALAEAAAGAGVAGRFQPDYIADEPGAPLERFTHAGVAERLDRWTRGLGTRNEDRILELTYGLHLDDRIQIAVELARRRAARGDRKYGQLVASLSCAEKKKGREGRAAVEAARTAIYEVFRHELVGELDDRVFGRAREGILIRAQLDPANVTGEPQAHDVLMLDLAGLLSKNGEAVQRLLQSSPPEKLRALDAALRRDYHLSLEDAVKKLRAGDERRALFLVNAPRVDGRVPVSYVRAFELHEAVRGLGTDETRVFRILESMSERELRETAAAFHLLYPEEGEPGGSGAEGDLRASALYHRLRADVKDLFGTHEQDMRLGLAFGSYPREGAGEAPGTVHVCGLRYEPDPSLSREEQAARERLHRELVASYVTYARSEIAAVLGLVKPDDDSRVEDGRPTFAEVESVYERIAASDRKLDGKSFILDVQQQGGRASAELVALHIGKRLSAGAKAALQIRAALDDGFLGLGGTKEELVYQVLDRPELSPAERRDFLEDLRAAYGRPGALRRDLEEAFGRELAVSGGAKMPPRAIALEAKGTLTPAERLVYALNEPGTFGVFGAKDIDSIVQVVSTLGPIDKIATISEYARLTNRSFWPGAGGNPLAADLARLKGHDAAFIAMLAEVLPQEEAEIAASLGFYLDADLGPGLEKLDPEVAALAEAWVARNFGDEDPFRPGLDSRAFHAFAQLVRDSGGARLFAARVRRTPEEIVEELRDLVSTSRGHTVSRMLVDFFGPEGVALEDVTRRLVAGFREYGRLHTERAGQERLAVAEERLRQGLAELTARVAQYERLRGARADLVSNVAWTIGLAAALVAAPHMTTPTLLALLGAGTGGGVSWAFDDVATRAFRRIAVGAVVGATTALGAAQMARVPAKAATPLRALQGGVTAAGSGSVRRFAAGALDEARWRHGAVRGVTSLVEDALAGAPDDFARAFVLNAVTDVARKQLEKARRPHRPAQDVEDSDDSDPIDPGGAGDPGDGPNAPGPGDGGPDAPADGTAPGDLPGDGADTTPPGDATDPGDLPGGGAETSPGDATDPGGLPGGLDGGSTVDPGPSVGGTPPGAGELPGGSTTEPPSSGGIPGGTAPGA